MCKYHEVEVRRVKHSCLRRERRRTISPVLGGMLVMMETRHRRPDFSRSLVVRDQFGVERQQRQSAKRSADTLAPGQPVLLASTNLSRLNLVFVTRRDGSHDGVGLFDKLWDKVKNKDRCDQRCFDETRRIWSVQSTSADFTDFQTNTEQPTEEYRTT